MIILQSRYSYVVITTALAIKGFAIFSAINMLPFSSAYSVTLSAITSYLLEDPQISFRSVLIFVFGYISTRDHF